MAARHDRVSVSVRDWSRRAGFTMITVLWVMTVASVMAAAAALAGRCERHAQPRSSSARSGWRRLPRVPIRDRRHRCALPTLEDAAQTWRVLDRAVLPVARTNPAECHHARGGGNASTSTASNEMIGALLQALGYGSTPSRSSTPCRLARHRRRAARRRRARVVSAASRKGTKRSARDIRELLGPPSRTSLALTPC